MLSVSEAVLGFLLLLALLGRLWFFGSVCLEGPGGVSRSVKSL